MWTVQVFDPDGGSEGQTFDTEVEARLYIREELKWESTESCELYNADMALVEHQPGDFAAPPIAWGLSFELGDSDTT